MPEETPAPPAPPRNLILCCDGTNNQFGRENTNVVRLVQALDRAGGGQVLFYNPGVGTMPEPGWASRVRKKMSQVFGLAFGLGLASDVCDAYSFLMDEWRPGDHVYLFGFSRGAYTARVLAAFLHQMGLLPPRGSNMVPYAFRLFEGLRGPAADRAFYWTLCDEFRETFARPTADPERRFPVRFLGVWDSVSSYGWAWNPRFFPFTATNPGVQTIRHAVAVDERRAFFRTNLFGRANADLKEYWFPGVHADVGGGYPAAESRLWHGPLKWIADEAAANGLKIDAARLAAMLSAGPATPAHRDDAHESLTWKWWFAEFFPKTRRKKVAPPPGVPPGTPDTYQDGRLPTVNFFLGRQT